MKTTEVHLTKRVQTKNGRRYCPAVISANGRIKPDHVVVDGKEERHVEGAYYIEWRADRKRIRVVVGKNALAAAAARHRKEVELTAINVGIPVTPPEGGRRSLTPTIAEYLEEV